jgi:hypothetical protein
MDEAWVANSILEPTVHDMFYNQAWSQTSPPLFLLAERWITEVFGPSEMVMRVFPAVTALLGFIAVALVYGRWLTAPAALLALTSLCANYYLLKYPQQVKQYGSDFAVSALLLLLLATYLESPSRWRLSALVGGGVGCLFLAHTTGFWLPTLILTPLVAELIRNRQPKFGELPWRETIAGGLVLGGVFVLVQIVFVAPTRTPELFANFRPSYIYMRDPVGSLLGLITTFGMMMAPGSEQLSLFTGSALILIFGACSVTGWRQFMTSSIRDRSPVALLVLGGALPILCACVAGALHIYPVLLYPRMLLFSLPGVALLLGYAIDVLLGYLSVARGPSQLVDTLALGVCVVLVVGTEFFYFGHPRPNEDNRPAITYMKTRVGGNDLVYIHEGMYEQFKYYRLLLDFRPSRIYIGNHQWPCCATGDHNDATSPGTKDFGGDLAEAAARAKGQRLWLLFPAGAPGHWSGQYTPEFNVMSENLARNGCERQEHRLFGQTLIEAYSCR